MYFTQLLSLSECLWIELTRFPRSKLTGPEFNGNIAGLPKSGLCYLNLPFHASFMQWGLRGSWVGGNRETYSRLTALIVICSPLVVVVCWEGRSPLCIIGLGSILVAPTKPLNWAGSRCLTTLFHSFIQFPQTQTQLRPTKPYKRAWLRVWVGAYPLIDWLIDWLVYLNWIEALQLAGGSSRCLHVVVLLCSSIAFAIVPAVLALQVSISCSRIRGICLCSGDPVALSW